MTYRYVVWFLVAHLQTATGWQTWPVAVYMDPTVCARAAAKAMQSAKPGEWSTCQRAKTTLSGLGKTRNHATCKEGPCIEHQVSP